MCKIKDNLMKKTVINLICSQFFLNSLLQKKLEWKCVNSINARNKHELFLFDKILIFLNNFSYFKLVFSLFDFTYLW